MVWKLEGCPGQSFRFLFGTHPVENRGVTSPPHVRTIFPKHPTPQNIIWKYQDRVRNFIGMPQNEVIIELGNERTQLTFMREGVALYGVSVSTKDVQKMVEQLLKEGEK